MGNDNVPFGGRGRPINPRFSLNNEEDGVETEDFAPKRVVNSFPERVKRAAPQPFSQAGSAPVHIPSGVTERKASPNSLFNGGEDELSLDVGVNETSYGSSTPASDVPRSSVIPIVSSPAQSYKLGGSSSGGDNLSLDVGVNETEDSSSGVSDGSGEVSLQELPRPVKPAFENGDAGLSLDVGVNESEDGKTSEAVSVPVHAPVSRLSAPSVSRPRAVNPLFADPSPQQDQDSLSLDVGVNEAEEAPAKRVISPRFDFKSDSAPKKRKVDIREVRPDSMVDVGGMESFDEEKKASKGKKKVAEPSRRAFQIQERDIVLLRFLTKYQFSYVDALARLLDSTPQSINNRLRTLEEYELVKRQRIAAGSTLWQTRKAGIQLAGMNFTENKRSISFATIPHTIGLVNLAADLEREAPGSKDILGLADKFGEQFPVMNRFPGGIRLYGDEAEATTLTYGEMTVSEREIRQAQKRYRGGRSSAEMRDLVDFSMADPTAPELEVGNESLFVVYGTGGSTGEHVPDLVVTRPRDENGKPQHFAIELELTPKSPADWKRILRSYRDNGGMYSRIYYFTPDKSIANMVRNADSEVGLGERLVLRKYTPKNKRQPFLG